MNFLFQWIIICTNGISRNFFVFLEDHMLKYGLLTVLIILLFPQSGFGENLSEAELIDALTRPSDTNIFRGFKPKANPDAITRVCDPELNKKLLESTGQQGELLTRTLYVEAAPSIDLDIQFKRGAAELLPAGKAQLDALSRALDDSRLSSRKFVLAGHTDSDGSVEYNDRLSCERALAVRNYLKDYHRVDPDRMVPMGFGYQKLKDPSDPKGEINRRVEVRLFNG